MALTFALIGNSAGAQEPIPYTTLTLPELLAYENIANGLAAQCCKVRRRKSVPPGKVRSEIFTSFYLGLAKGSSTALPLTGDEQVYRSFYRKYGIQDFPTGDAACQIARSEIAARSLVGRMLR